MYSFLTRMAKVTLLVAFYYLFSTTTFAQARIVINSDFEQPLLANPNTWGLVHHTAVPGWVTTSSSGMIEFWRSPFQGVTPPSGQQHIELNANEPADLFFDACMFQGEVLTWSFFHRGRAGRDSARLLIGPPGAEVQVLRFGTNNNAWVQYTGNFTNTFGNTTIRFRFQPISTANGNLTVGNFIDNVQIVGLHPIVEFQQPTYSALEANGGNKPRLIVNGRIPAGGLTVNIEVVGGTASAGVDFTNTILYTIPQGDYDGNTSIDISSIFSINDDNAVEGDETVVLRLMNPQVPLTVNDADCSSTATSQATYTILDDDAVLGVDLSEFTVKSACEANYLSWITQSAWDHAYFVVEHSRDALEWTPVGRVNSLGDGENAATYHFTHQYPTNESYYRLKMVDVYGEVEYSDVIFAQKPCVGETSVSLYPNPLSAGEVLKIRIPDGQSAVSFRVVDLQGRVLKSFQPTTANSNVLELDTNGLSAGTYQLVLLIDGAVKVSSFVIL